MPTIVADSKDAKVPPNKARKPSSESITRLVGANPPIPPICIPMDAKLANPQSI